MLVATDFAGDWQLTRAITDRLGGMDGELIGMATLTGQGGGLRYDETGRLTLKSGPVMEATRSYHWHFTEGIVRVQFADGADFHNFIPSGEAVGTTHLCGADLYDVVYDFRTWPKWTATWSVKGPRKDYTSVSRYQPAL
jgi:hypothetical protein